MKAKTKLKRMVPTAKKKTTAPDILFKCPGKCDHRQLSTGTEAIDIKAMGINRQNNPRVTGVRLILMTQGDSAKITPQHRTTVLYPYRFDNVVEASMAKAEGTTTHNKMIELVAGVISMPSFFMQEKKQMLTAPQMPIMPHANLIRAVPMKVSRAYSSAYFHMFIIGFIIFINLGEAQ